MPLRSVNIPNSRLTEGQTYPFRILKSVSLGPDDNWFVMQDPLGYKILMPKGFYEEYGFEAGQLIHCRVDKINCNGRMFLEPRHPFYQEGNVYQFEVTERLKQKNILGEDEWLFRVKDRLGKQWEVRTWSRELWESNPGVLPCMLERIKKGKLFLRIDGDQLAKPLLKTGEKYPFTIVDEKINPRDGFSYFILSDHQRHKHLLKKKYYTHYRLKKGMHIQCRVDKFTSEGFFFLEPEHPCYHEKKDYDFKVHRMEELVFSDGFRQKVLVLLDCFEEEVKVHVDEQEAEMLAGRKSVRCHVDRIRKSRLELKICPEQPIEK